MSEPAMKTQRRIEQENEQKHKRRLKQLQGRLAELYDSVEPDWAIKQALTKVWEDWKKEDEKVKKEYMKKKQTRDVLLEYATASRLLMENTIQRQIDLLEEYSQESREENK